MLYCAYQAMLMFYWAYIRQRLSKVYSIRNTNVVLYKCDIK